jgi:23S rRNA (cytosine1962-C5)-methyltransferase
MGAKSRAAEVRLAPSRDKSVRQRHPWLFAGAIASSAGLDAPGQPVEIVDASGAWLARGTWSRRSQIRVRIWTWDESEAIDGGLVRRRVERAVALRRRFLPPETEACRLVYSESDGLPGLIVDRYGDWLVVQFSSVGLVNLIEPLMDSLIDLWRPAGIIDRSDRDLLAKEGLEPGPPVVWGRAPEGPIEIREHGARHLVDLTQGQKTGAYLDQRDNRARVGAHCRGLDVLSCFSYSGGFEIQAAMAGARSVVGVDSSAEALSLAERSERLNDLAIRIEWRRANVFEELRALRAAGRQFDAVILDPPKLVPTRASLERGLRAYKDLNLQALRLLRPDGLLATFSCSGQVGPELFQKVVFGAAVDAGREVQVVERLDQPADHPVLLTFPESHYLRGLLCRVV